MNDNKREPLFKHIGNNIKTMRKYRGITPKELSDMVGVEVGSIRNIESGKSISLSLLISISHALKFPIDTFIHDYAYHDDSNHVNREIINQFCIAYQSCSDHDRKLLLELVKSFGTCSKELNSCK